MFAVRSNMFGFGRDVKTTALLCISHTYHPEFHCCKFNHWFRLNAHLENINSIKLKQQGEEHPTDYFSGAKQKTHLQHAESKVTLLLWFESLSCLWWACCNPDVGHIPVWPHRLNYPPIHHTWQVISLLYVAERWTPYCAWCQAFVDVCGLYFQAKAGRCSTLLALWGSWREAGDLDACINFIL